MSASSSRESGGHRPCGGLAQGLRAGNRIPLAPYLPSGPAPALGSREQLSPLTDARLSLAGPSLRAP